MKTARTLKKILLENLCPVPKVSVSSWADEYRMLPSDSAEPGRWKTSRVPYMQPVMDAFTEPNIKRIVVKSAAQVGKSLSIDEPIATVDGFKLMRDIEVGDKVFDENGEVCNVIGVSPIRYDRDCYEITFSDGAKIVADAEHNWYVQEDIHYRLKEKILTTEEIAATFKVQTKYHPLNRYAIPCAKPLKLPAKDLPIDSYLFGYWLGDGTSERARLTVYKDDLPNIVQRAATKYEIYIHKDTGRNTFSVSLGKSLIDGERFTTKLRSLGVLNNKHIPAEYLRGSYEQRLELLRGLMDTDGNIDIKGQCHFIQKNTTLTEQILELIWSLGFKGRMHKRNSSYNFHGETRHCEVWDVYFYAYDNVRVFNLPRKYERQKPFEEGCPRKTYRRRIVNVEKVESRPVKCIAVDSPNHLFLAGKALVPSHNSEVMLNIVGRTAMLDPCTLMIIQPTLAEAQDFSKARLKKMIQDTKVLTPLFGEYKTRDANQTILSKFFKGGRVILVGANSPAGLASKPIKILLCDEVDRYPASASGNEGDPVELAARRTSTYWDSRIALFSTPTAEGASRIDVEYLLGTQEQWTHRCPNCEEFSPLDYRQMQVDYQQRKDESGNKVIVVDDVKWRCPQCGFEFDELTMKSSAQKYIAQNPDALRNGIRSFYVNGFSSPWLEWKNIMREWLEARGDANREAVVYNTRFGLSYKQAGYYDDENVFLERREDYPAELPDGVLLLTAAVDVQANRLEYEIVGWRDGFERFGILRGLVRGEPTQPATWLELDSVLDRTFHFSNGIGMTVARTFIDSGYSTTAVYNYCHANMAKGRFPIKGKAGAGLPLLYKYGHPQNSNVILTILGVDDGKQEIMNNLGITEVGAAGYMHFPRDDEFLGKRGYDINYFKELISEHKVIKKSSGIVYETFEKINDKERNESLDLACYSLACVKSCIGNSDEKVFWQSRRELLRDDLPTVKQNKPTKKPTVSFREVDIWN